MNSYTPIILGGLLPALFWGITAVLQKLSATALLGPGRYLTLFGIVIALCGCAYAYFTEEATANFKGAAFALAAGLTFSLGTGLLSFALWRYGVPISRVTPILSANVLIPVFVGLAFLGENAGLSVWQLVSGTALIVVGAVMVTSA